MNVHDQKVHVAILNMCNYYTKIVTVVFCNLHINCIIKVGG